MTMPTPTNEELETAASRLFSKQAEARQAASQILRRGESRSLPLLHRILSGTFANRLYTTYASDFTIPRFSVLFQETYKDAAKLMAESGEKGIGILIGLLTAEEELVRDAAAKALSEIALNENETRQIRPLLRHRKKAVCNAATTALSQSLSNEYVFENFATIIIAEVAVQRRKQTRRICWKFFGLFLILAGLIATRWYPALEKQFIPLIWVFALFSGSWVVQKMVSPRAKKALSALQGKTDFRMLSTLLHLINEKHDDVGKIATQELIRLLPLLKPEDRRYLNDEEMKLLLRPLQGSDTELILAILKGLEQIGDERAIPAVTRLAERTAATRRKTLREMINSPVFIEGKIVDPKIKVEREISAAARACLPFLHQRVHDSMLSSTLLRASEQNATAQPAELLRPASSAVEQHEAELLRPTAGV